MLCGLCDKACDTCKYGLPCNNTKIKDLYYCDSCRKHKKEIGPFPIEHNCDAYEMDKYKYDLKYKQNRPDINVSKELVNEELDKILFGIKLKDKDTIMKEILELKEKVKEYKEPLKCSLQ